MTYVEKAKLILEKLWPVIWPWFLIPVIALYVFDFLHLLITVCEAAAGTFLILNTLIMIVGVVAGILDGTSKEPQYQFISNTRLGRLLVGWGMGYRFADWVLEEKTS